MHRWSGWLLLTALALAACGGRKELRNLRDWHGSHREIARASGEGWSVRLECEVVALGIAGGHGGRSPGSCYARFVAEAHNRAGRRSVVRPVATPGANCTDLQAFCARATGAVRTAPGPEVVRAIAAPRGAPVAGFYLPTASAPLAWSRARGASPGADGAATLPTDPDAALAALEPLEQALPAMLEADVYATGEPWALFTPARLERHRDAVIAAIFHAAPPVDFVRRAVAVYPPEALWPDDRTPPEAARWDPLLEALGDRAPAVLGPRIVREIEGCPPECRRGPSFTMLAHLATRTRLDAAAPALLARTAQTPAPGAPRAEIASWTLAANGAVVLDPSRGCGALRRALAAAPEADYVDLALAPRALSGTPPAYSDALATTAGWLLRRFCDDPAGRDALAALAAEPTHSMAARRVAAALLLHAHDSRGATYATQPGFFTDAQRRTLAGQHVLPDAGAVSPH